MKTYLRSELCTDTRFKTFWRKEKQQKLYFYCCSPGIQVAVFMASPYFSSQSLSVSVTLSWSCPALLPLDLSVLLRPLIVCTLILPANLSGCPFYSPFSTISSAPVCISLWVSHFAQSVKKGTECVNGAERHLPMNQTYTELTVHSLHVTGAIQKFYCTGWMWRLNWTSEGGSVRQT